MNSRGWCVCHSPSLVQALFNLSNVWKIYFHEGPCLVSQGTLYLLAILSPPKIEMGRVHGLEIFRTISLEVVGFSAGNTVCQYRRQIHIMSQHSHLGLNLFWFERSFLALHAQSRAMLDGFQLGFHNNLVVSQQFHSQRESQQVA